MKCTNCGNKIEDGKLYCDFCGKAVQVVPDYNAFDDEALASLLKEQNDEPKQEKSSINFSCKKEDQKKMSRKRKVFFVSLILLAIIVVIFTVLYTHSGKYYYAVGEARDQAKDYQTAISFYEKSESAYPLKSRVRIGEDYYKMKQYDDAETILLEAIDIDDDYEEAYRILLEVYNATKDYDAMQNLKSGVTSENILSLFTDYVTDTVEFSEKGGSYHDDLTLALSAPSNYTIYYTLDGTPPTKQSGTKYKEEIELSDGTTTVKAICVNNKGEEGAVVSNTYKISYKSPDYPEVTPSSGTYHSETLITMTANSGERIYYTWDGSTPTSDSEEYIDPIVIPEGNHILSVIVINKHGMSSDVLKMNYQYLP